MVPAAGSRHAPAMTKPRSDGKDSTTTSQGSKRKTSQIIILREILSIPDHLTMIADEGNSM